jgi:hypothetical protein
MHPPVFHTFHIPVMGLGYTIDTPLKVARFGISSVVSIIEDHLVERMRELHCKTAQELYEPIPLSDPDHREKRITAYLNLMQRIVERQTDELRRQEFTGGSDICKYFELLPVGSPLRAAYKHMLATSDAQEKKKLQDALRNEIHPGAIDVNIMTKVDRNHTDKEGVALPPEYSDAQAALRGFAKSKLNSSVIFSAGLNPRLYSYCESFSDFYPDEHGGLRKKIVLKVSDFRSAQVQGKFLAKKGLWVSEFRIESGLNCGGHAFATEGMLLGPILAEFSAKKNALAQELGELCNTALRQKGYPVFSEIPALKLTAQGGIGTAEEDRFLLDTYRLDATGWGSPFLLVPEVTNVDDETLNRLATAEKEDFYISYASPLGIAFNNFKKASSEEQRKARIAKNRPGSPCYKKFLAFNTEFTKETICTSSREYQNLKIKEIQAKGLPPEKLQAEIDKITEKDCLCEGLGSSALLKNNLQPEHGLTAVSICPGPNLAYFSGVFSLHDMVDHIYGRKNILNKRERSHMFVNELRLYIDFLRKEISEAGETMSAQKNKYLHSFRDNLIAGIAYYKQIFSAMQPMREENLRKTMEELATSEKIILDLPIADLQATPAMV